MTSSVTNRNSRGGVTPGVARRLDPSTADALEILESRWAMRLLAALAPGPARFGELETAVAGVSRRMMVERLRELEAAGLVCRVIDPGTSIKGSYGLTGDGQGLAAILAQIRPWALARQERTAS